MKNKFILLILSAALITPAFSAELERNPAWNKTIDTEQGKFVVDMQKEEKKISIKKISPTAGTPPHLRLRILRKEKKPLQINLRAVNEADEQNHSPLHYTGKIDQWNESYIGLQLEFSFDKKKWKKLGEELKP